MSVFCLKNSCILKPKPVYWIYKQQACNFASHKWWFIVSNNLLKSSNTPPTKPLLFMDNFHFSSMDIITVSVLYPFLHPHNWGDKYLSTYIKICFCIILSRILDTTSRTEHLLVYSSLTMKHSLFQHRCQTFLVRWLFLCSRCDLMVVHIY